MQIVRKRRLAILISLVLLGVDHPALAARFVDMDGLWSTRAVNALSDQGVIPAAEDGRFNPDSPLNRATMARWLNVVFKPGLTDKARAASFADVSPNSDYLADIQAVTASGLMPAVADGFRPNGLVTRGQFLSLVTAALKLGPVDSATATRALAIYPDRASFAEDARDRIAQAQVNGLIAMPPKTQKLEPIKPITRGIAAVWMERASTYRDKREIAIALAARMGGFAPVNNNQMPQQMPQQMFSQNPPPPQGYAPNTGFQSSFRPGPPPQSAFAPGPAAQSAFMPQTIAAQQPQSKFLPANQVANLDTGTSFKASLEGDASQTGQNINATLQAPVFNGPQLAIPAGSRLSGKITDTANGMISMTFTRLQTPDGRQSSLVASARQARKASYATGNNTAGGARPNAYAINDIDVALDQPLLLYTGRRGY